MDASSCRSITSKGQVTIPKALPASGFGLLKSRRPSVPVDFDPASLLAS